MVLFNYSTRELTAKVVYYGPGLCGKTTNLQYIYDNLPGQVKGKMLSLATKTDRTLFFDFLPIDLGEIRGMRTRIQLYTVPGQVFYNETRRLVLKGADGVVFVADSQRQMMEANIDSFRNLEENLKAHGLKLQPIPLVLQFNKRDLPNVSSIEEMNAGLNQYNAPFYESVATTGIGVQDTLKAITKLVLLHLTRKYDVKRPAGQAATSRQGDGALQRPVSVRVPASRPVASHPTSVTTPATPQPRQRPAVPVASELPRAAAAEGSTRTPIAPAGGSGVRSAQTQVSTPAPQAAMPPPSFESASAAAGEEVVELVDMVDESDSSTLIATSTAGSRVGISRATTGQDESVDIPVEVSNRRTAARSQVTLTEVAEGDEIFSGGGEVVLLEGNRPAEVVIPVEVSEAGGKRRFKLSLQLTLSDTTR